VRWKCPIRSSTAGMGIDDSKRTAKTSMTSKKYFLW
jgi:hypothetical protein